MRRYLFWQVRFDLASALRPPDARVHQLADAWASLVPLVHGGPGDADANESHDQRLINALHEEILVLHEMANLFARDPPEPAARARSARAQGAIESQELLPPNGEPVAPADAADAEPVRAHCLFLPADERNLELVVKTQFKRCISFLEHAVSRVEPIGRSAMTSQFLKDSDRYWLANRDAYLYNVPAPASGTGPKQPHSPKERDEVLASKIISFLHSALEYLRFRHAWEVLFGQWVVLDSSADDQRERERVPYECFFVGRLNTNLPVLRVLRFARHAKKLDGVGAKAPARPDDRRRRRRQQEEGEEEEEKEEVAENSAGAADDVGAGVGVDGRARSHSDGGWFGWLFGPKRAAHVNTKLRKLAQACDTICALSAIVTCLLRSVRYATPRGFRRGRSYSEDKITFQMFRNFNSLRVALCSSCSSLQIANGGVEANLISSAQNCVLVLGYDTVHCTVLVCTESKYSTRLSCLRAIIVNVENHKQYKRPMAWHLS